MKSEHVRLTHPESIYGQKNFLQAQLEILNAVKKSREFQKLRKEEIMLKIDLRSRIESTSHSIRLLQKFFPRTEIAIKQRKGGKISIQKERLSLEQEIEDIRRKLEDLK